MGGIGMLAEQGGHSRGGRAVETDDGYVLTLRQKCLITIKMEFLL